MTNPVFMSPKDCENVFSLEYDTFKQQISSCIAPPHEAETFRALPVRASHLIFTNLFLLSLLFRKFNDTNDDPEIMPSTNTTSSNSKISLSNWLRPKKSRQKLRKRGAEAGALTSASSTTLASIKTTTTQCSYYNGSIVKNDDVPPLPPIAPLQAHRAKYRARNAGLDTQLGENIDYTTLLHSMSVQEGFESDEPLNYVSEDRPRGEPGVASLPSPIWCYIADSLDPKTAVCLALASKTLYSKLGPRRYLNALNNVPENRQHKLEFLVFLDRYLPYHLLCIPCAQYHRRIRMGQEKLAPTHTQVLNPVFDCPNERNALNPPSRHRIAHGRSIPFTFVQLATRAHRYGSLRYGIKAENLGRRWKYSEPGGGGTWSISTRYHIHENRLLMRVVSQCFAPPGLPPSGKRLLLYSRDDYWPFFSVCPHWRDGELMDVCKCALDHIPVPRNTAGLQGIEHKFKDAIHGRGKFDPYAIPSQCGKCQPMRRCPRCPTEYLIEVKITEDNETDPSSSSAGGSVSGVARKQVRFRHAIVVTRWSDLGDGSTPASSAEWAACNDIGSTEGEEYDSFKRLGRRGICGIFESAFTHDTIPGRRIISMNPDNKTGGEKRNDWY
ncbi:conserved hypothetical protein [Talaromyces stipitatus ATCC 10500]|uniref:F-box domain protein n=1 Tax=Talaromyces stipitatus (strain ATCC 10500 / CBS 375.48 / QM 6759 / NRRL 1006) TaxID=441959 RepID=B8MNM5_TALSN|nr:uncharacterized protein TSTA_103380 [Talaromyces stipitatus ATCC 10500]EED14114.1 conserved hypothetical protein [Talaromyces stipitatus ATCC 10500]